MPDGRGTAGEVDPDTSRRLPPGVESFEPPNLLLLHTAILHYHVLRACGWRPRVLILRLSRIPALDARGRQSIMALARLAGHYGTLLVLSEVGRATREQLGRTGAVDEIGPSNICTRWDDACARAVQLLGD